MNRKKLTGKSAGVRHLALPGHEVSEEVRSSTPIEAGSLTSYRPGSRCIPVIFSAICMFALLLAPSLPTQASSGGVAPGAPGAQADWTPANKEGFGTAHSVNSKIWYTLQDGRLTEVYYPNLGTPGVRDLEFIVSDGHSFAEQAYESSTHITRLVDPNSLTYQ